MIFFKNINSFSDLVSKYSNYPEKSIQLYSIYRDLLNFSELCIEDIIDFETQYIIKVEIEHNYKVRLYFPVDIDDDLDLVWLHSRIKNYETSYEVYLAIYSTDSIIYQKVELLNSYNI
jgi:hypothetical protein